ncbi:hypothetical protein BDU57DRAFT_31297 [Ampelomyces quisqualis]|uniref:Uncharacterized protein n=1 Tax=Ampelomyces quisqualis TaxID=50730 RepID=A0A6A5QZY3_AMPQU|nr:hypothetical protein BDU57DRAFT_31297 [Ampelomyces quisqualis]
MPRARYSQSLYHPRVLIVPPAPRLDPLDDRKAGLTNTPLLSSTVLRIISLVGYLLLCYAPQLAGRDCISNIVTVSFCETTMLRCNGPKHPRPAPCERALPSYRIASHIAAIGAIGE